MRNPSFERPVRTIVRLANGNPIAIRNAMNLWSSPRKPKTLPGLIRHLGTLPKPTLHAIIQKLERYS